MATITDKAYDPAGTGNFVGGTPVITADSLSKPQKQVQLPPPVAPTPPSTFINNLQPAIQQSNQGLIQAQTEEAAQRNDVLKNLLRVDDPNSQGTYDSKFRQLGGNDYLKQFTDANTRLAQLQGVFNTGSQKVSSAPGQSQVFEGLQLNEVSRQKAVEVGNQALVVQAMQGNIETARQIALDTTRFASEDRLSKLQSLQTQFNALDGIVQGQEKQLIDAQKVKVDAEIKQLERAQTYIDTAIQSGDASVEEMKQLTRTDLSDFDKQNIAALIINRSSAAKTAFERANGKFQLSTDGEGNPIVFNTRTGEIQGSLNTDALNQKAPDGSKGGQCGEFAKTLVNLPTPDGRIGNTWDEKKSFVDQYGLSKSQVLGGDVQVGDVLYYDQSIGSKYGHVETVISVNGDGSVTVKGSNLDNNETVYTRTVNPSTSPSFYGSIRGQMKAGLVSSDSLEATKGKDGFVDPTAYLDKRRKSKLSADEFDKKYGDMLSPQEQVRLGVVNAPKAQSAESIKLIENASSGLRALDVLKTEIDNDGSIINKSKIPGLGQKYKSARGEIIDVMARLRTGAALTQEEEAFYKSQLPGSLDSSESAKYKLEQIRNFLQGVINRSQGQPTQQSSGGSADPLGIR